MISTRIMIQLINLWNYITCFLFSHIVFWKVIYRLKHNGAPPLHTLQIIANSIICNLWWLFFLTPAVSHVHHCEVITQDLTNDVLVFVWMYWSALYLGRYLSLFRMAGLQAGMLSLSFMPCLQFFASLASLTALLYWINSSCHFPCW